MSGLEADAGFIYQRKVVLLHALRALSRSRLRGLEIEAAINLAGQGLEVSVDFEVREDDDRYGGEITTSVEVKSGARFGAPAQVRAVVTRFVDIDRERGCHDLQQFKIVHACATTKALLQIQKGAPAKRARGITRLLGGHPVGDVHHFADRFVVEWVPDACDGCLDDDDATLRSHALLRKVLKASSIEGSFGQVTQIYDAMRRLLEDRIHAKARLLKDARQFARGSPPSTTTKIALGDLLGANGSLFDLRPPGAESREAAIHVFKASLKLPDAAVRETPNEG